MTEHEDLLTEEELLAMRARLLKQIAMLKASNYKDKESSIKKICSKLYEIDAKIKGKPEAIVKASFTSTLEESLGYSIQPHKKSTT